LKTDPRPNEETPASDSAWRGLALAFGVFSFGVVLSTHTVADNDLWGKLAIGAHVWKFGTVPLRDMFAFTPVLPRYIEHEWGAGTIFFGVLKFLGPAGLLGLRTVLAFAALWAALATGRKTGGTWEALLVLAIPAAACLMLGYIPVLRSQALTYAFFAGTLLGLEAVRKGERWPLFVLPWVFLVWSNVHGGFVAGLGAIAVYLAFSLTERPQAKRLSVLALACVAAALVNVYGFAFWRYLIPALLNRRPRIAEWQPLPLFADDIFNSFRILFALVAVTLVIAWRRTAVKSWPGVAMLAITATLAWHSRRHAPFFGIAALALAGPYLAALLSDLGRWLPPRWATGLLRPAFAVTVLYGSLAVYVAANFLPDVSFALFAPVGHDPVREADILSMAQAEGHLATPFRWGCYCSWRLYPRIKISMDGRYETTYPESTFELNDHFYQKSGPDWDRLIKDYRVDYVILDLFQARLRPEDLTHYGYSLVWIDPGRSALMALSAQADRLRQVAAALPPTTIDPADASLPDRWWKK
jgi:hypothetical protein